VVASVQIILTRPRAPGQQPGRAADHHPLDPVEAGPPEGDVAPSTERIGGG
jgi:hypothetical protein